jgi:uroporphyrinogen-III decarboxylase
MNACQRVMKTLDFQESDRVPTYQMIGSHDLIRRFGGQGDGLKCVARAHEALGIDSCCYTLGSEVGWIEEMVDSWGRFMGIDSSEWGIEYSGQTGWINKRPFHDLGTLAEHLPQAPDQDGIAESFIDWFIPTRDALLPHTVLFGTVTGCFVTASLYCGMELFFEAILRAPKMVQILLDVFTDWALAVTTAFAANELGPAFHLADDIAHRTSLLVSPKFLRQEQFPRLKRIIAPLKEKGIKVIYHSDGDLSLILDGLVTEVGIDGLHPVEPVPGMDIFELRRKYPRLILMGNLDLVNVLKAGKPALIEDEVKRLVTGLGPGGGYFFGTSSDISDDIPLENVLAMLGAVREFGRYPMQAYGE